MPTGWRPKDVIERFPIMLREIDSKSKYKPQYNFKWKTTAVFHFIAINIMLLFFLYNFGEFTTVFQISFGFLIFISVFGFTALMDYHNWAPYFEIFRGIGSLFFLYLLNIKFPLNNSGLISFLIFYFLFAIVAGIWAQNKAPSRNVALVDE